MGRHSSTDVRYWDMVTHLAAEDPQVVTYMQRLAIRQETVLVEQYADVCAHVTGVYGLDEVRRKEALDIALQKAAQEIYGDNKT